MYIEVENKRLTAKFIAINNQVMDQFTIYKDLDNFTVPRTNGTSYTATCECTEDLGVNNSFTHYLDNKGNLLLSINKHNINIGKVGVPPFEVKLAAHPVEQMYLPILLTITSGLTEPGCLIPLGGS